MSVYMSRADEIMLFVVYLAILGILYGIARNSARRQKGLLFGVTVPETALELPQVQVIIRRFKWLRRRWPSVSYTWISCKG